MIHKNSVLRKCGYLPLDKNILSPRQYIVKKKTLRNLTKKNREIKVIFLSKIHKAKNTLPEIILNAKKASGKIDKNL